MDYYFHSKNDIYIGLHVDFNAAARYMTGVCKLNYLRTLGTAQIYL